MWNYMIYAWNVQMAYVSANAVWYVWATIVMVILVAYMSLFLDRDRKLKDARKVLRETRMDLKEARKCELVARWELIEVQKRLYNKTVDECCK